MGHRYRDSLNNVKELLKSLIAEVDRTLCTEFPYQDSKDALEVLKKRCESVQRDIFDLDDKSPEHIVVANCNTAIFIIESAMLMLGFILRSTNVRNAFELHGPFLRITRQLLAGRGDCTRLLFSSEWNFSPITYPGGTILGYDPASNADLSAAVGQLFFVLIGQPASESANPFILPLAGHELGHSVWKLEQFEERFSGQVRTVVLKVIAGIKKNASPDSLDAQILLNVSTHEKEKNDSWIVTDAVRLCLSQVEELFCDIIGVRIFGPAFLHAFSYLLSAEFSFRSPDYPSHHDRAKAQIEACNFFGFDAPVSYLVTFSEDRDVMPGQHELVIRIADASRKQVATQLNELVKELADRVNLDLPDRKKAKECFDRFRWFVPATEASSLANILNAAWDARHAKNFFKEARFNTNQYENLKEVVLKSIEVFEVEQRIALYDQEKGAAV
jgi:hypothetical protein